MRGCIDTRGDHSIGGWFLPENNEHNLCAVIVQEGIIRAVWNKNSFRINIKGSKSFSFRNVPQYIANGLILPSDDVYITAVPAEYLNISRDHSNEFGNEVRMKEGCRDISYFKKNILKATDGFVKNSIRSIISKSNNSRKSIHNKVIFESDREVIFEDLDTRLVACGKPDAGVACFSFQSAVAFQDKLFLPDALGFGEKKLRDIGVPTLHFINKRNHWYHLPNIFELIAKANAWAKNADRRIGYGTSMGGYAALAFSAELAIDEVLAFAPQFSVDPAVVPWESRWTSELRNIKFQKNLAVFNKGTKAIIPYDPNHILDARHVELIRNNSDGDIVKVPLLGVGHFPIKSYLELDMLSPVVKSFLSGRVNVNILKANPLFADNA